jgi:hypothetical protein
MNETTLLINHAPVEQAQVRLKFIRRYSSLINQVTIFALDCFFFVGKLQPDLAPTLSQGALVALSATGFISLPYNIDLIRKSAVDCHFGYRAQNYAASTLGGLRVLEVSSNLALLMINFGASVAGATGNGAIQTQIYQSVTAWGIAAIVLGTMLNLSFLFVVKKTQKILEETDPESLFQAFTPEGECRYQAAMVRLSMDKDTLGVLMSKAKDACDHQSLQKLVHANLKTEFKSHWIAKLTLGLVGDALMAVEKYYTPNSLVTASINLGTGTVFTGITLIRYTNEYKQRQRIASSH